MRLIDADRLKAEIMGWCVVTDDLFGMGKHHEREIVLQAIEDAPTIAAAPVVRGEWLPAKDPYDRVYCYRHAGCGCEHNEQSAFCPACGAKMKGDTNER